MSKLDEDPERDNKKQMPIALPYIVLLQQRRLCVLIFVNENSREDKKRER